MVRNLLASFVGAVIAFFCGFFVWVVMSTPLGIFKEIPFEKDAKYLAAVDELFPATGTYLLPPMNPGTSEAEQAWAAEKIAKGPTIKAFVNREGSGDNAMAVTMGAGFVHMWAAAFFATVLLGCSSCNRSYIGRVGFLFGLGTFTAFWAEGNNMIWWRQDPVYSLYNAAYLAGIWLVAGIAMAALTKPKNNCATPQPNN